MVTPGALSGATVASPPAGAPHEPLDLWGGRDAQARPQQVAAALVLGMEAGEIPPVRCFRPTSGIAVSWRRGSHEAYRVLTGVISMTEPSHAVFLSYASQDAQAAQRICEALRAADIEVWFDRSELRGGDSWDQSIRRQIKSCALFIPVISKNTHDRDEGYFRLEWKLAVDRCHLMAADRTFLLPVVVDDSRDDDERVPERFREVQWTRLPAGETPLAFVERILRLLMPGDTGLHIPGREPTRLESTATPPRKASALVSRPKRSLPIAVSVVLLGTLVYLSMVPPRISSPPPVSSSAVGFGATTVAFKPPPHSIAVLPFINLSGDPKQDYFSDGMSEELINALSSVDSLEVIARTSSFSFKGQNVDISTIAQKLNVGAILQGSVRRSGSTVRVAVQLINAVTGFQMWSQEYDRQLRNVLQLQTDIESGASLLDDEDRYQCLAIAYRLVGERSRAEREMDEFRASFGDSDAYEYAGIYAQWGDRPAALQWLAKAERLRDPGLQSLKTNWLLDPLRNEPAFLALEHRLNFPP